MKAAFAIPGDLNTPTGGYAYARRFLRGAASAKLEIETVRLGDGFPNPAPADLRAAAADLGAIARDRPLLVDGLAYGALGPEVIGAITAPIVALCHHPLALETGVAPGRAAELKELETDALAAARHVIVTSTATGHILNADYGVPPDKLTVAPPGTDPAPRAPGSGGAGCRLLSVGSLTPRKGHLHLIRVLAGMTDLQWTLTIIGPAPDPDEAARIEAAIERANLGARITIAGPRSVAAVAAAYQAGDLFVLASEYEGFGMAFAEAMSHGLPVLGCRCAAVAEATRGGAELVDPADLGRALRSLIADPELRMALADRCWDAAQGLARWNDTVRIIADVLRSARV